MSERAYDKLTTKRKLFVDKFIENGGNGQDAYMAAGYSTRKKSTAAAAASRLLKDESVQQAIKERTGLSETERLLLNKQIMDKLISKAKGEEQEIVEEDDHYRSTPKDADQMAAVDRLYKYYVLSPMDEYFIETKIEKEKASLKLIRAEAELKEAQAEALRSGDSALDLIDLDTSAILEEFDEEEGDEDD